MISPANERELVGIALQLIDQPKGKPRYKRGTGPATAAELNELREAIRAGYDPLGANFIGLRAPDIRRPVGAVYTPPAIVEAMIEWAVTEPGEAPARVVDPGTGSGRFLHAAALAFPDAQLIGAEIDPVAIALLKATASVAGFADRLIIHAGDYRTLELSPIQGRTLFIGNPPYVRHHEISEAGKTWFGETALRLGFRASKLAGLHIHFFLRTREIARLGDFGAYITSSEWMDVNYGSVLRQLLANGLGGTSLHVLNPDANPFANALTTGAITCFRVGNRPKNFSVRTVTTLAELKPLSLGKSVSWVTAEKATRWSTLARPMKRKPAGFIELGELFRVHRGQVTGMNAVWIAGPEAKDIPARYLFPAVTRAREIFSQNGTLETLDKLRSVIDLPIDLDELTADERRKVARFLRHAAQNGAHETYIAKNRRAWWAVGLREPPLILCTYMARRAPAFIRNIAGARYLNIAHGLYPRQAMTEIELASVLRYLRETVGVSSGRTYAGGLTKFEPGEVQRLHIPTHAMLGQETGF
jgi:adenine-specific DNA-methyltransferase